MNKRDDTQLTIIIGLVLTVIALCYVIYSDRHPDTSGDPTSSSDVVCYRSPDGGMDCN